MLDAAGCWMLDAAAALPAACCLHCPVCRAATDLLPVCQLAHEVHVLAFLVRTNSSVESRGWLDSVASTLIAKQRDECGAIREYCNAAQCANGAGRPGSCFLSSNAEYGTGEGGLIQSNNNSAADLLYTQNMAFRSLNEAAQAVGRHSADGARYMDAADKLSAFFSRAQIQAEHHPKLRGACVYAKHSITLCLLTFAPAEHCTQPTQMDAWPRRGALGVLGFGDGRWVGPVRDRVGLDRRLGGGDDGAAADELELLAGRGAFWEADRGRPRLRARAVPAVLRGRGELVRAEELARIY